MNERDFSELAAAHALHALSPEDERDYFHALDEDPERARTAEADAATAAMLADAVVDVTPPRALRRDLLARIADIPQDGGEGSETPHEVRLSDFALDTSDDVANESDRDPEAVMDADSPRGTETALNADTALDTEAVQTIERRRWTRGLLALAASFVLLLGLGFGAAFVGSQLNTPVEVMALHEIEAAPDAQSASIELDDGGVATAHWSGSLGKAVLVSNGLPAISKDQSFELWFVRDDGTPVAAGVFEVGEKGDATAVLDGSMEAGDAIAVTVEEAGGSPTGKPTTDPIIVIPTA